MKRNLSAYSQIIFYYNKRIHRKYKAFLTKVWEKFLTTIFRWTSRRRHMQFFFFIGSQNRFHLLIYTPWARYTDHFCSKFSSVNKILLSHLLEPFFATWYTTREPTTLKYSLLLTYSRRITMLVHAPAEWMTSSWLHVFWYPLLDSLLFTIIRKNK